MGTYILILMFVLVAIAVTFATYNLSMIKSMPPEERYKLLYFKDDQVVNVNIRMYNFDDVQCTVIPSVAYGFVTGMNLQLC